jgi:gliding motility-associated-like protein
MKPIFPLIFLILLYFNSHTQCSLNLSASKDSVLCGEDVILTAFGSMDGNIVFQEDFNGGNPTGWQFTQSVTIANNTCGVPSPDGTDFMWMGSSATNPRDMTTNGYDLSLGGNICFDMRYAVQGNASPCEGPDEPDEGVGVRYSVDNGVTWNTIQYWNPNGGNSSSLTGWNTYCVTIPPGAQTTNTMIQWHQNDVSGADYDHWGIDNVQITLNDPNSQITWLYDGYNYALGSGGGDHPVPETITANTTYTAQITNGTNTCTSSITIPVRMPTMVVFAGNDTSICPNECININARAKVIKSPAKIPTYTNAEVDAIIGTPATPAIPFVQPFTPGDFSSEMNINITDLNQTALNSSSITSVCITGFNITAIGGTSSLADAEIVLNCPGGNSINLVNVGDLTGNNILNMCFDVGGIPITSGTDPYTGSFAPAQPFSGLNGCDPNGVWKLTIEGANNDLSIPVGGVDGWSITFDDPEISYPAPFSWSPTTNMTGATSLTPIACPTTDITYTLTANDSNMCVTQTDDIAITILPSCCVINFAANVTSPSCGLSDGAIDLTVSGGSGNYSYNWGANGTTQDLTMIPSGTYQVTVTDITAGCNKDTTISIGSNAFTYTSTSTNPTCGNADGTITINVTGGLAPIEYSIDSGVTFFNTNSFPTQVAGVYNVQIRDANSCLETTTITLTESCCNFVIGVSTTPPSCGASDGAIDITVTGGSGTYTYNWGPNGSAEDLTMISSGIYNLRVTDAGAACYKDTVVTFGTSGVSGSAITVDLICYNDNSGRITLSANGGATPYTYSIGSGNQNTAVFNSISAGNYTATITDAAGCIYDTMLTINQPNSINTPLTITAPTCYNSCDGNATVNVNGGTIATNPIYSWTNNTSTTNTASNLCSGSYTLSVTDDNGCIKDTSFNLSSSSPVISDFTSTPETTTILNPQITHNQNSTNGNSFIWYIDGVMEGTNSTLNYTYPDANAGVYNTCLVTANTNGCQDSVCKQIIISNDLAFYIPNAFTPDNDGKNDIFTLDGIGINETEFDFLIFNRWGEVIWTYTTKSPFWDGSTNGIDAPEGIYVWSLNTKSQGVDNISKTGHVLLIR